MNTLEKSIFLLSRDGWMFLVNLETEVLFQSQKLVVCLYKAIYYIVKMSRINTMFLKDTNLI